MTKNTFMKALLGASALTVFAAGSASAVEVPNNYTTAATPVSNTFTLTYDVGGVTQPPIDSSDPGDPNGPTVFNVDRLVDLTVESLGDLPVAPGAVNRELTYSLQNLGNDTHAYDLSVIEEAGDDFNTDDPADATPVIQYYIDDGDGVFQTDGTDGALVTYNPASPPVLGPDEVIWVVVTQDIPVGATDTQTADITLLANTLDNVAGFPETTGDAASNTVDLTDVENVLADSQGTANEAATPDGAHSDTGTYTVAAADVTAIKDVVVHSQDGTTCGTIPGTPVAGGYYVPEACVEYVITVTNSGTAAATDINVNDILPSELRFATAAFGGAFTGGSFNSPALPGANTDCNAGACVVNYDGGTLPAPVAPATETTGTVTIRAFVK